MTDTPKGLANVWGRARLAISNSSGILRLSRATYSTCSPKATVWSLWSNKLKLDRNTGRGEATNALIYLQKVPVFYTPYINFPIDKRRKSGFLLPTYMYSAKSGVGISIPYYLNLAPNYDATFSPRFFASRGVLLNGLFRYLTTNDTGKADFSYVPYDRAFVAFRDSTVSPGFSSPNYQPFKALQKNSDSRMALGLQNDSRFDEHWQSTLKVNYASDDYFLHDFGSISSTVDNDQLLNRADISYSGYRWNFLGRLQGFQTLHPITDNKVKDQHKRLPQLNLAGDFPDGWGGLNSRLDSEIVNFVHRDDFYGENLEPIVSGARVHVMPGVSKSINWLGGCVTPRIQLPTTGYSVCDRNSQGTSNDAVRSYPLTSIDSNMVFRRNVNFLHSKYTQTLEPRVFYLFVPEIDQSGLPLFDTYLPPFDFSGLFRTNRFSGIDRVGDANQVTLAASTRLLNDYGQEELNIGIGQIISFRRHQITINSGSRGLVAFNQDPLEHENLSPLVGQVQYLISPRMNAKLNAAWDPNYQHLNTLGANLQCINNLEQVVNFWYNYVLQGDQWPKDRAVDLSRIGLSAGWKIRESWHIIGSLNYNVSYERAQNYFYGLEYDSCCWAMRVVHAKDFINIDIDGKGNYDSRFYLQFLFKGFSNLDLGRQGEGLAKQISGYLDKFAEV